MTEARDQGNRGATAEHREVVPRTEAARGRAVHRRRPTSPPQGFARMWPTFRARIDDSHPGDADRHRRQRAHDQPVLRPAGGDRPRRGGLDHRQVGPRRALDDRSLPRKDHPAPTQRPPQEPDGGSHRLPGSKESL